MIQVSTALIQLTACSYKTSLGESFLIGQLVLSLSRFIILSFIIEGGGNLAQ